MPVEKMSISVFWREGDGANEKWKSGIGGDGTPFPQSRSWTTYGERNMAYSRVAESFWRQLAIACPDINNYFTTDSSFRILLHFSEAGVPARVRDHLWLRINIATGHGCYCYTAINIGSSFVLFAQQEKFVVILTVSLHALTKWIYNYLRIVVACFVYKVTGGSRVSRDLEVLIRQHSFHFDFFSPFLSHVTVFWQICLLHAARDVS